MELVSPGLKSENHGTAMPGGNSFQSNWSVPGSTQMPEVGGRKADVFDSSVIIKPSQGGDVLSRD